MSRGFFVAGERPLNDRELSAKTPPAGPWVVRQFDYGSVPDWKWGGSGRIFWGWRPLFNAIAAPSTDALKRSSWYRKRVTRSAQSAAQRWNRGWSPTTFPHTNLLNAHRQKVGRTRHPQRASAIAMLDCRWDMRGSCFGPSFRRAPRESAARP